MEADGNLGRRQEAAAIAVAKLYLVELNSSLGDRKEPERLFRDLIAMDEQAGGIDAPMVRDVLNWLGPVRR